MASLKLGTVCALIVFTLYSITLLQNRLSWSSRKQSSLTRSKRDDPVGFNMGRIESFAKGGYQQNCSRNPVDTCDPLQFLACGLNFKCDCLHPVTQYYDHYDQYCKIKAGETCYNVSGIGCTNHAQCVNTSGPGGISSTKCTCHEGTTANKYGKCTLLYGQVCVVNGTHTCDKDGYLECDPDPAVGTCRCERPGESWFDPLAEECLLLAGASCVPNFINASAQPCAQNSVCVVDTAGHGTCTCIAGATEDNQRRCALPYGHKCSGINDYCDRLAHLECNLTTYSCDCANPNATWYDPKAEECRIRGGHPCILDPGRQMCVQKAECLIQEWGESYCTCHLGLSPGVDGQCIRNYGESCKLNDHEPERCDAAGHEKCLEGLCMCENPMRMTYNERDRRCYMSHNSPCSESSAHCDYNLACVNGLCKCDAALGLTDDGSSKCTKMYGIACAGNKTDISCDSSAYLECQHGTCECAPGYVTVPILEVRKCLGQFKSMCRTDEDCDHEAALVCGNDGRCRCYLPAEHFWDATEMRCLGKLNSRCHFGRDTGDESVRLGCGEYLNCQPVDQNHGTCQCSFQQKLAGRFCGTKSRSAALNIFFKIHYCLAVAAMLNAFLVIT